MPNLSHINNVAKESVSSLNNISYASLGVVNGITAPGLSASFVDAKSVAKSITTGNGQSINISDSDGHFNFIHSSAYTISFWVKAGWNSSLNTNIHLFSSNTFDAGGNSSANMIRIFYHESHNRLYFEYRSASNAKKSNFYLFHSTSGRYNTAYQASGLGSSYWSASNRGNVGDNDYTMITVTKGTSNNAGYVNAPMYWNASTLGEGHYSTNGTGQGTPNMTNVDRKITLGSNSWSYAKSGNSAETKFNDLTIWDKKLSASEVSELYNAGTRMDATTHSAAANLKMYHKWEGDGASSVNNSPSFAIQGNSNIENK